MLYFSCFEKIIFFDPNFRNTGEKFKVVATKIAIVSIILKYFILIVNEIYITYLYISFGHIFLVWLYTMCFAKAKYSFTINKLFT